MTLYFAYGANMERAAMRKRCPGATALGVAVLRGWRYLIARGYGAFARAPGRCVYGVLWRLTPRDLAALNMFESLDSGLYRRVMFTVEIGGKRARALIYVGRGAAAGRGRCRAIRSASSRPRPTGECRRAISSELRRLAPGYRGARPAETGEIG